MTHVLLVVLDAVRTDHLSAYGYGRRTSPTLERLAAEGVAYERAVSAAPWTLPSHASLFTGRYPSRHRCIGTHPTLDADQPVVAELLRGAGYRTVGFSNSSFTGTARGFARGFDVYHDLQELPHLRGQYYEFSPAYADLLVNYARRGYDAAYFQTRKLAAEIRRADGPLFGFVNLNAAHSPYNPPRRFREWCERDLSDAERRAVRLDVVEAVSEDAYAYMAGHVTPTEAEWDLLRRWYDGEIRYLDSLLADLVATLERAGVYDDTTVVVTADHGEQFGENGLAYHQFSLSEALVNVPLVVKPARGLALPPADELVSLVDLAPTFLEVAGVTRPREMTGRSLLSEPEPAVVFAEYGYPYPKLLERKTAKHGDRFGRWNRALQAARTRTHKLVVASDGETTLYDIRDGERVVVDDAVARDLARAIDASLGSFAPADGHAEGDLDDHVTAHLERLGYL
jgi:arylsulfatase A-like enzyme